MTQQRSDDGVQNSLEAELALLIALDFEGEGPAWWDDSSGDRLAAVAARTAIRRHGKRLARVAELEQENERKQTILDQDWFSLDDLMKERARAERAEANAREMESRWATALDLLSERTARLWVAEDALSAAALAGLSLQEGRDDA